MTTPTITCLNCKTAIRLTSLRSALTVATILRRTLLQVGMARQFSEGQQAKSEMIYRYLTVLRFWKRVDALSIMQEDLGRARKAIMKQWANRQAQIERVMGLTVGIYGDLQGISKKLLQEIEGLGPEDKNSSADQKSGNLKMQQN